MMEKNPLVPLLTPEYSVKSIHDFRYDTVSLCLCLIELPQAALSAVDIRRTVVAVTVW